MGKSIVIVGAGLGGMAAALRLAHAGHQVEVWEKNEGPGGKIAERREAGFRWDLGPSLLTMPHVLAELFEEGGLQAEDHLPLTRLESACRYLWRDGTVVDEDAAFWRRPEVARFLAHARGIYELSGEAYLKYPPAVFWRTFSWRNLARLRHLPKVAARRTLAEEVERHFRDPHLRQLFGRFATYNGSSPYRAPATFAIIPYIEARFGAWYVRGGMAEISRVLAGLAEARGVRFHYGTAALRWNEGLLEGTNGRSARPEIVLCNQDVRAAARSWLAGAFSEREKAPLEKPERSMSGFAMTLGVSRRFPQLRHHNLFFSDAYQEEFTDLFERRRLPGDPTIYLSVTARSDPADAPPGADNYFILVNAPAQPIPPGESEAYADQILARLEASGLPHLRRHVLARQVLGPGDFATRDGSGDGALYGTASHSLRSALFRPPLWRRGRPGLYFVGGTTHPGGGIPLVLLSAKMVAEKIGRA